MSLSDYAVKRDKFEQDMRSNDGLCFPCVACLHRWKSHRFEPCRTCDHNINAIKDDVVEYLYRKKKRSAMKTFEQFKAEYKERNGGGLLVPTHDSEKDYWNAALDAAMKEVRSNIFRLNEDIAKSIKEGKAR